MTNLDLVLNSGFMQNAAIAGLLAALACGFVGPFVVAKKIGHLAGGIAHAALGGMGVAYYYGLNPLAGAMAASLLSAAIIGWVTQKSSKEESTLINAIWAIGMAIGVVFIAKTPGYNADLMSYLFGNILMVTTENLILLAGLNGLIIFLTLGLYKELQATCFDEEFAEIRGVNVRLIYGLLLGLVALTTVLLIQAVGLILVIALLTLPAATARVFRHSIKAMMGLSFLLGVVFTSTGIALSYITDLPAGATIILITGAVYLGSLALIGKRS